MSSIDERVVSMRFDGSRFGNGIRKAQDQLGKLNQSLKMRGATDGLNEVNRAAGKFNLAPIGNAIEQIAGRFGILSVAATTAFGTIVSQATMAGTQLVKSLTIAPVMEGFREYETNMGSIQTILANTSSQGTNLKQVGAALDELNHYSDKTIYNFAEMASNIGTFTAAGVSLDTSTAAIKGIANLAAVSGSNSQQASTAMYQLSQALAAGKVTLMDWNSVVNAGMGGKVFQDSLMETARTHGVAIDDMVKKEGGFRNTLQKGWLSSEILTETLNKFTGDMTESQLKQLNYTDEQIKSILAMGKTAQDAATKVKTFSQLISTLQEAVGSGWSQTWKLLFGDFEEAKKMFTNISNVLGDIIGKSSDSRNKLIEDWKALGGRDQLIKGLANVFDALMRAMAPIGKAFREIFPATTGKQLAVMTNAFVAFTEKLKMGATTSDNVRRTFKGFFAILDIGRMIISGAIGMFVKFFSTMLGGSGSILETTASLGDMAVALRDSIKNSDGINKFFNGLGKVISAPIAVLKVFLRLISPIGEALGSLVNQFGGFTGIIHGFNTAVGSLVSMLAKGVGKGVKAIGDALSGVSIDTLLAGFNAGVAVGIVVMINKLTTAIKNFKLAFVKNDSGPSMGEKFRSMISPITDSLSTMQNALNAATLVSIAAAIALISGSIIALSKVKTADMAKGVGGITVVFGQLAAALLVMTSVGGFKMAATLPGIATGLLILAAAVRVLVSAVTAMSDLDWTGLAKGLTGIAGVLLALGLFTKFAAANKAGLLSGAGLVLLATGVRILASAVSVFATMDAGALTQGILGMTAVLAALAAFTKLSGGGAGLVIAATAIGIVSGAMVILSGAIALLGNMDLSTLAKGIISMAAALTIIGVALTLIPPTAIVSAAAVAAMAVSLTLIAGAVAMMGSMSWEEIAKSMVAMAGALTLLGLAVYSMTAALPGAAALVVAAGAIAILVPPLIALSTLQWGEIGKGLVALGGALTIVAVAGIALAPAIPGLLGLGAAAVLIGAAALAAGVGITALGVGLKLIAEVGGQAAGAIGKSLEALGRAIAGIAGWVAKAVANFIVTIAKYTPQIVASIGRIMAGIMDSIVKNAPKIAAKFGDLMVALHKAGLKYIPQLVDLGMKITVAVLNGIAKNIKSLVTAGTNVAIMFMRGISQNSGRLADEGAKMVIAIVNGIANAIRRHEGEMNAAGRNLGGAIAQGMASGITGGIGWVTSAALSLATSALGTAKRRLGIRSPSREFKKLGEYSAQGFANGLRGGASRVDQAIEDMFAKALEASDAAGERVGKNVADLNELNGKKYQNTQNINAYTKAIRNLGKAVDSDKKKFAALESARAKLEKNNKNGRNNKQIKDYYNKAKALSTVINKNAKSYNDAQKKLGSYKNEQAGLNKELAAGKKELAENASEQKRANAAWNYLNKDLLSSRVRLRALGNEYDYYTGKIEESTKALEDAKRAQDDYRRSILDSYSTLPEVTKETSYTSYVDGLKTKISDAQTMTNKMNELKSKGLNDSVLKDLVGRGANALPFMQNILDKGQSAINELNYLNTRMVNEASGLGAKSSVYFYQSGVDSAQGLLNGFVSQKNAIEAQMDKIANMMVNAINKKLGIRSPSRVFAEVGKWASLGLVKGLEAYSTAVTDASSSVGDSAVDSLRKAIANAARISFDGVSLNPTIRPVLDLTSVERDAARIGSIIGSGAISVDGSYSSARAAESGYNYNQMIVDTIKSLPLVEKSMQYVQNIYSPKAVSAVEIYRQTKSQLSVAKG